MSTTFILLQILSVFFSNFCLFPYYCNALHASRITHLPGFNGSLPFYLETGYVTVNEESGAELFYYFVESERNPSDDPLILFLVGGPYCSGFSGLALDVGPLRFMVKAYDGTLPTLIFNPFSWTKISSIIFLDWPVGTGFSFSPSIVDYHTDEVKSAKQIYKFLIKWLLDHPSFQSNPFYVAGDSYGGKMAPLSALEIVDGNENFQQPFVNLKGYLVGNPVTGERIDISSQPPHAYGLGIISDELLKLIQINCVGEDYQNPKHTHCARNLKTLNVFLSEINKLSILSPKCPDDYFELREQKGNHMSIKEKISDFYAPLSVPDIDCANDRLLSNYWSNDRLTKEALHIKELIMAHCAGEKDFKKPQNVHCATDLETLNGFLSEIDIYSILGPTCPEESPTSAMRSLKENQEEFIGSPLSSVPDISCIVELCTFP